MVVCITSRDLKTYYQVDDPSTISVTYSRMTCSFLISFKSMHKRHCISLKHFDIVGNCKKDTNR